MWIATDKIHDMSGYALKNYIARLICISHVSNIKKYYEIIS